MQAWCKPGLPTGSPPIVINKRHLQADHVQWMSDNADGPPSACGPILPAAKHLAVHRRLVSSGNQHAEGLQRTGVHGMTGLQGEEEGSSGKGLPDAPLGIHPTAAA